MLQVKLKVSHLTIRKQQKINIMSNTARNKMNKSVRTMPGGNEILDNVEAWHARLKHFKREGRTTEANLAQEALNDLQLVANAMRDFAHAAYKKSKN